MWVKRCICSYCSYHSSKRLESRGCKSRLELVFSQGTGTYSLQERFRVSQLSALCLKQRLCNSHAFKEGVFTLFNNIAQFRSAEYVIEKGMSNINSA